MGAELLLNSIGFKSKDHCLIDEAWARQAFARARRAIKAIDATRLAAINLAQDTPYADVKACKGQLLDDLKAIEQAVFGHDRQAGILMGGDGILLLLAAGMSWGDSPGELFDSIARLLTANVLHDARFTEDDPSKNPS
jgi:hypothetical protein